MKSKIWIEGWEEGVAAAMGVWVGFLEKYNERKEKTNRKEKGKNK